MKRITIFLFTILFTNITYSQNRVWDLPVELNKTIILDAGNGKSTIVSDHTYGTDSAQIHVLDADASMNLSHKNGFRLPDPITILNDATLTDGDLFICGANKGGFNTRPYFLRMDIATGNVLLSGFFSNLDNQDQLHSIYASNGDLDIFTSADVNDSLFYLISGNIIGQFPMALKVSAPSNIGFRVHDTAPTENDHEYMVICQADTSFSESKFLILMRMDTAGIQWALQHDHGTTMNAEFERGDDIQQLSDGNWIYTAAYRGASGLIEQRLVKMDGTGNVTWSKEYFYDSDKLRLYGARETSDGGLLLTTLHTSSNEYYVNKLNSMGEVQWSQKYVQGNTNSFPMLSFFQNDQDQLYGYTFSTITEMNENIDVCDMYPSSGITSMDVTFDVNNVSISATTIVPERFPMPYELRAKNYVNTLSCLYDGIDENEIDLDLLLFPDPVQDQLNADFSQVYGNVDIEIFDLQGRLVISESTFGGAVHQIDVENLPSAAYLIVIQTGDGIDRQRFIKE